MNTREHHCIELMQRINTSFSSGFVWGAVRKNIISDRFSTKTAISALAIYALRRDS